MFFTLFLLLLGLFSKDVEYSLKDLKILSSDITIESSNPEFEFYIPTYKNIKELKLNIKVKTLSVLNTSCKLVVFVDDRPYKTSSCKDFEVLDFNISSFDKTDFVKIKIAVFSQRNNLCDIINNKIYLTIYSDSKVFIRFNEINSFEYFLKNYSNNICLNQKELLPLSYYLNLNSKIPYKFEWGISSDCKTLYLSTYNLITSSYVFIDDNGFKLIRNKNYSQLFFSSSPVFYVLGNNNQCRDKENMIMFSDLGIIEKNIDVLFDGSFTVNFDISKIGYIPKKLNLLLNLEHTPVFGERSEIRLYSNGNLVGSYPLKGFGSRKFNFSIPSHILNWGINRFDIKVLNSIDTKYCNGLVYPLGLTIFSNSYFYWSGVYSKTPQNISDFLRSLHGRVVVSIEDENLSPLILSLISNLSHINQNIKELVIEKEPQKYDFLIVAKNSASDPFEIYNPLTKETVFKADYNRSFVYFELKKDKSDNQQLNIYSYGNPNIKPISKSLTVDDFLKMRGDFVVIFEDSYINFDLKSKMKIRYNEERSFVYFWEKYKLVFLVLFFIIITLFLFSKYRKLTNRVV